MSCPPRRRGVPGRDAAREEPPYARSHGEVHVLGDAHEIAKRAEEGMLPVFQSQPGFRAYSLIASGDEVVSFSAWDSAEQADAANAAAREWIAENLEGEIGLKEAKTGEILLSTTLDVTPAVTA
jgi:hypothetical protein